MTKHFLEYQILNFSGKLYCDYGIQFYLRVMFYIHIFCHLKIVFVSCKLPTERDGSCLIDRFSVVYFCVKMAVFSQMTNKSLNFVANDDVRLK